MSRALRAAADAVFANDDAKRHKYYFSITEEEIIRGVLDVDSSDRSNKCLWIKVRCGAGENSFGRAGKQGGGGEWVRCLLLRGEGTSKKAHGRSR